EEDLADTFLARAETLLDWVEEHETAPYGDGYASAPGQEKARGIGPFLGNADELGPKRLAPSLDGPMIARAVEIAGEGAPMVSDMALVDLAATLSRSVVSATRLVGGITELAYRLPRLWARVRAGEVPQGRALRVAERTIVLPWGVAAAVDVDLVSAMKSCASAQVDRVVQGALDRDPAKEEPTHADDRFLSVFTGDAGTDQLRRHPDYTGIGLIGVEGVLDTTDALDLEHAIRRLAQELAAAGSEEPLRVRRAKAVGLLARGEVPMPAATGVPESLSRHGQSIRGRGESGGAGGAGGAGGTGGAGTDTDGRGRAVTLVLHLSEAGLFAGDEVGRCEHTKAPVRVDQLKQWCRGARVTVRPV